MSRTACLNAIYELAKKDERVVFIGSDLSPNTLSDFKCDFPERFFMEGVNEQNCIGMAAGLAMEGFIPYVNTIATFITRRCYEQVVVDIAMHNLPVRLIANGGGLLYAPLGPTHCAIDDIAIMRAIPNMSVVCCSDGQEMTEFMQRSVNYDGPIYIRLGKDSDPVLEISNKVHEADILIVSTGIMSKKCFDACDKFEGMNVDIAHVKFVKPLNASAIDEVIAASNYKLIVTAEEGIINGGLGSAVIEFLSDNNIHIPVLRLGLPDAFPHHYGEQEDLLETYGLTTEKIAVRIKEFYDSL